ncbi:hypothetical protein [Micromonospora sp. CA-246542]|uniref:hypothetical protein n=1 Tax=Micromonospora sp. CA-246542 TaxID=3239959 RepID=UPI003D917267
MTKPLFIHLTDDEFADRYGSVPTSILMPLFASPTRSIYLDSGANVIFYVTPDDERWFLAR